MTMELMKYRLRARRHRIIVLQRLLPPFGAADRTLCGGYVKLLPRVFQAGYMRAFIPLSASERSLLSREKERNESVVRTRHE